MTLLVLWKYIIKYKIEEIVFLMCYRLLNEGCLVHFSTLSAFKNLLFV